MVLTVNGETTEAKAPSVRGLLAELDYEGTFFAVAVNHDVLPRARWDEPVLREGDEVEIITPRQGG